MALGALFDWECLAHGVFEGPKPGKCPHGCGAGMVKQVWISGPGIMSSGTKKTDKMADKVMDRFGMTDMSPVAGRASKQREYRWNDKNRDLSQQPKPYSVELSHDERSNVIAQAAAQGAAPSEEQPIFSRQKAGDLKPKVTIVGIDNEHKGFTQAQIIPDKE